MREPREHPRIELNQGVVLTTDYAGAKAKGLATLRDLSRRGLGFETQAELKRGDMLFMKISLPVTMACQVRYVKATGQRYRCGARIDKLGLLDTIGLIKFLRSQKQNKSGG